MKRWESISALVLRIKQRKKLTCDAGWARPQPIWQSTLEQAVLARVPYMGQKWTDFVLPSLSYWSRHRLPEKAQPCYRGSPWRSWLLEQEVRIWAVYPEFSLCYGGSRGGVACWMRSSVLEKPSERKWSSLLAHFPSLICSPFPIRMGVPTVIFLLLS